MSAPHTPRTGREGVSFHGSPLLIGSAIAAVASTVLLAVVWYVDSRGMPPPRPPGADNPPRPPDHIMINVVLGLCIVAWLAVLVALCRDQIVRQINRNTLEILAATREYGEHRETEGYLKARRAEGLTRGGDVVQFPRQAPPPDHD